VTNSRLSHVDISIVFSDLTLSFGLFPYEYLDATNMTTSGVCNLSAVEDRTILTASFRHISASV